MNHLLKWSAALLLVLGAVSASAQDFNVVKVDSKVTPSASEGIYYSLPQTQFEVEITVIKVEKIKGPYAEFASKYLGLTNVITENSAIYELGEISISTLSVPDPEQYYFVELSDKNGKIATDLLLSLSESGIIQNTTGDKQDEKELANITIPPEESNVYPDIFKYFSDLNLFEQVDTVIETVKLDTSTIEKKVLVKTLVQKTPEQKAKDAADFIIKVKENRFNLISGYQEVNYDKETFSLMNSEMEKLEMEYQKLFTGLTFTKTLKYHFSYIPDAVRSSDSVALFSISRKKGVLSPDDPNGDNVYLTIKKNNNTYLLNDYVKRKSTPKTGRHGLFFRTPDYADLTICTKNKLMLQGKFLVSQYGVITHLPAGRSKVQFYPGTGAVKQVTIEK